MMHFHCTVVSAEDQLFEGDLQAIIATSVEGDLGIYPGHAPLLAMLSPGPVRLVKTNGEEEIYFLSGGFLEVQPDGVFVLADSSKRTEQLSEEAVEKVRQDALHTLHESVDRSEKQQAAVVLANAVAQLRTINEIRKKISR